MKGSILTLVILMIHEIHGYSLTCPHESQRRIRANGFCKNTTIVERYACLYDERSKSWDESCTEEADYVSPGRRYVISGNRKSVECPSGTYQPSKFLSNEHSSCVFRKSECSEEGQILINHGTPETDVVCRCDYRKGYTFVHSPKNYCDCDPSIEDCTCYRKPCRTDEILSRDYLCIPKVVSIFPAKTTGSQHRCTEIHTGYTTSSDVTTTTQGTLSVNIITKEGYKEQVITLILASSGVVFCIYLCTCFILRSKQVKFRCRFCGKIIADSSSCINKDVTNAKVVARRKTKNDIPVQEITSNCDNKEKFTIFYTKEASSNVIVQVQNDIKQENSYFKDYSYEEVICECTSQMETAEGAPANWKRIGWKYTCTSIRGTSGRRNDVFYGFLEQMVLDDTCDILCNTANCHNKIAKGPDISTRQANKSKTRNESSTSYSNQTDVLIQTIDLRDYGRSDIITTRTATVSSPDTCAEICSNFEDFKCCKVFCCLCKQHIGWKHKPIYECPTQALKFYVLILDRLFDAKAALKLH